MKLSENTQKFDLQIQNQIGPLSIYLFSSFEHVNRVMCDRYVTLTKDPDIKAEYPWRCSLVRKCALIRDWPRIKVSGRVFRERIQETSFTAQYTFSGKEKSLLGPQISSRTLLKSQTGQKGFLLVGSRERRK